MMEVQWSEQAQRGWKEVALYILRDFGLRGQTQFQQRTKENEKFISHFPKACEVAWKDPETGVEYRRCPVYGRSIMLYFVQGDTIVIADFWDVRGNH